ncbi:hypothetical protein [Nocardia carnea]|uniref:hypothetical protein n=1 Tax=Nocardia carnea TaxID=37328 RepID=UPI0024557061|nr:hypothetical protein [Nocardia carnea]
MAVSQPPGHKLTFETDPVASAVSGSELWRGECSCGGMVPVGPLLLTDVLAAHCEHITTYTGPAPRPASAGRELSDVVADAGNPSWRAVDQGWLLLNSAPGNDTHTVEFGALGDLLDVPRVFANPLEPSMVTAMIIATPTRAELIVAAVFHPEADGGEGRWELRTHAAGTYMNWDHSIDRNQNPTTDPTAPLLALTLPDRCICSWWLGFREDPAIRTQQVRAG